MTLQVEVVSPERVVYSGEAEMVVCRAAGGEIAFLTGHVPFLGALGIGIVRIHTQGGGERGEEVRAAVHEGFVQVDDDRVIVLSDVAELPEQIDVERARRSKEDAERRLQQGQDPEAEAQLRRADVRLELAARA